MYVIENLGTPDYIVYQKVGEYAGNYAAIIISEQREIFAAVQRGEYKDAQYAPNGEKGYYNTLITAFYPNEGYIDERILIPENDVVYDKNEDPLQVASGVTPSDRAEGSSINSIRNPGPEVNKKFSMRDENHQQVAQAQDEANGKFSLLYANKKEAISLLHRAGHQLSGSLIPHDGFYHSIREKNSPVKPKFDSVTETQQFKRWFGDWQRHPHNASKIVNADGTPKVVYHGSYSNFSVFDDMGKKHSKAPHSTHFFTDDIDVGYSYQRIRPVFADSVQQASRCEEVQEVGYFRGAALYPQDWRLFLRFQGIAGYLHVGQPNGSA